MEDISRYLAWAATWRWVVSILHALFQHYCLIQFVLARNLRPRTSDSSLSLCNELITVWGYPCEEYQVTTADGYILSVQRIPRGIHGDSMSTGQPVYLQHGLFVGGESWVLDPPTQSLGFILADSGFDVWIGNVRGTRWSPGHVTLTKKDTLYWNWTWDAHASFDLPSMLQLVLDTTKYRVKYIGHSQGTHIFLAALSQTTIVQHVERAALLCPTPYINHMTSTIVGTSARTFLDQVLQKFGVAEYGIANGAGSRLVRYYCQLRPANCINLLKEIQGPPCCVNYSRLPYYMKYEPQSTSMANIAHLSQMIRTGRFQKYNYGHSAANINHYGQSEPPIYNLSTISTNFPFLLAYGGRDALSASTDVQHLLSELPSHCRIIYLPNYAHEDFIRGSSANKDLYPQIIQFFQ